VETQLVNPDRFVADFLGSRLDLRGGNGAATGLSTLNDPVTQSVRWADQHGPNGIYARVVIDLKANITWRTSYQSLPDGSGVRWTLFPVASSVPPPALRQAQSVDTSASSGSLEDFIVVVDAAHGGDDTGLSLAKRGVLEKNINLKLAEKLGDALAHAGARVILTRNSDVDLPISERFALARKEHAELFVSIHSGGYRLHALGIPAAATYYHAKTPYGRSAARFIAVRLAESKDAPNAKPFRDKDASLPKTCRSLRDTSIPEVIIEVGDFKDAQALRVLMRRAAQQDIATRVVKGISDYVRQVR
jgi:N-acetylmuramoyl-L-alanine amidase